MHYVMHSICHIQAIRKNLTYIPFRKEWLRNIKKPEILPISTLFFLFAFVYYSFWLCVRLFIGILCVYGRSVIMLQLQVYADKCYI